MALPFGFHMSLKTISAWSELIKLNDDIILQYSGKSTLVSLDRQGSAMQWNTVNILQWEYANIDYAFILKAFANHLVLHFLFLHFTPLFIQPPRPSLQHILLTLYQMWSHMCRWMRHTKGPCFLFKSWASATEQCVRRGGKQQKGSANSTGTLSLHLFISSTQVSLVLCNWSKSNQYHWELAKHIRQIIWSKQTFETELSLLHSMAFSCLPTRRSVESSTQKEEMIQKVPCLL